MSSSKTEETFTEDQINQVVEQWLEYGEQTFGRGHGGYFAGDGFAARALRYHLNQRKAAPDLLEALQDICEQFEGDEGMERAGRAGFDAQLFAARVAVAKA